MRQQGAKKPRDASFTVSYVLTKPAHSIIK